MRNIKRFVPILLILVGVGLFVYWYHSGGLSTLLGTGTPVAEQNEPPVSSAVITKTNWSWLKDAGTTVWPFIRKLLIPQELFSFLKNAWGQNWNDLLPDAESFLYTVLQAIVWFFILRWFFRKLFGKPVATVAEGTKGLLGGWYQIDIFIRWAIVAIVTFIVIAIVSRTGNESFQKAAGYLWYIPAGIIVVAVIISLFERLDGIIDDLAGFIDSTAQGLGKIAGNGAKVALRSSWIILIGLAVLAIVAATSFPSIIANSDKATLVTIAGTLQSVSPITRGALIVVLLVAILIWIRMRGGRRPRQREEG